MIGEGYRYRMCPVSRGLLGVDAQHIPKVGKVGSQLTDQPQAILLDC